MMILDRMRPDPAMPGKWRGFKQCYRVAVVFPIYTSDQGECIEVIPYAVDESLNHMKGMVEYTLKPRESLVCVVVACTGNGVWEWVAAHVATGDGKAGLIAPPVSLVRACLEDAPLVEENTQASANALVKKICTPGYLARFNVNGK